MCENAFVASLALFSSFLAQDSQQSTQNNRQEMRMRFDLTAWVSQRSQDLVPHAALPLCATKSSGVKDKSASHIKHKSNAKTKSCDAVPLQDVNSMLVSAASTVAPQNGQDTHPQRHKKQKQKRKTAATGSTGARSKKSKTATKVVLELVAAAS